ncbi:MAG: hypothetical protein AAF236_03750 [Verrucomicrobiota bacterium]
MSDRFCAYTFVDRIVEDEVGKHIVGEFWLPDHCGEIPSAVVCEAVGQLAAWSAMKAVDFKRRPVAGICGMVDFKTMTNGGSLWKLESELIQCDEEAVSYHGTASVDGELIVRMTDSLGPMVAADRFDDPGQLRAHYDRLRSGEAERGIFPGLPELPLERIEPAELGEISAHLQIPEEAGFFGDHFPLKPVFPGTLLMAAHTELADQLVGERSDAEVWAKVGVNDVKIRRFMSPGQLLTLVARGEQVDDSTFHVYCESRIGKRVTSSVRVNFSHR